MVGTQSSVRRRRPSSGHVLPRGYGRLEGGALLTHLRYPRPRQGAATRKAGVLSPQPILILMELKSSGSLLQWVILRVYLSEDPKQDLLK